MNIPPAVLDKLICDECFTLLTGVTYTFPEKDISLCNKCAGTTQGWKFREIAYEAVAANFLFPCANTIHGCWKKFKPSELQAHESFCPFTVRRCILECGWSGFESQLIKHFTDAHPTKILKHNETKLLKVSDYYPKFLILTESQIFQVYIKLMNQLINITIDFPYNFPKRTTYRASISCKNGMKKTFIIKNDASDSHSKFKFEENFGFRISILNTEIVIPTPSPENHFLLNSLICCKCKSYMSGKIYFCINGHNCCEDCKREPCICFERFLTRNHTLESLTEECLYPCKYPECVQILTAGKRAAHELTCEFATRTCPICPHDVKHSTFHDHLRRKHRLHVKGDEAVEYCFTEAGVIDCFYLHRMNGYFKLTQKYSRKMFYFSVQYWGNPALAGNYTFCLKMKSAAGEEFVAEQNCAPFTAWERAFEDPDGFLIVPSSVMKPFINSSKILRYHVYVYGKNDC